MKIINGIVQIHGIQGWSRQGDQIIFRDEDDTQITIPITVIARLYEGAKFDYERAAVIGWDDYINNLFDR
jgi:hypothetical protein